MKNKHYELKLKKSRRPSNGAISEVRSIQLEVKNFLDLNIKEVMLLLNSMATYITEEDFQLVSINFNGIDDDNVKSHMSHFLHCKEFSDFVYKIKHPMVNKFKKLSANYAWQNSYGSQAIMIDVYSKFENQLCITACNNCLVKLSEIGHATAYYMSVCPICYTYSMTGDLHINPEDLSFALEMYYSMRKEGEDKK